MESNFSAMVPYQKDVFTRADILSLSKLLSNLAANKYSLPQDKLSCGIMILHGQQSIHFDGPEDLIKNFPPFEPISGFYVSVICNPFFIKSGPTVSLVVSKRSGENSSSILVTASSAVDAQELALEIAETLPNGPVQHDAGGKSREPKKRDDADSNNKEPKKFYQSGIFWGAVGGLSSVAGIAVTLLIHFGVI